ncbi:hypothetical protein F2Q68_00037566 [Brassica cretica]|uniref:Uncharacterized protein n=1 Tax=Brassica cretica TaxID=69181 RepID=A0A8S9H2D0_BRACR|nr:hypothetical protein F2Q68_00037566 [Brassica cretica]
MAILYVCPSSYESFFCQHEEIVYRKIVGDPIFYLYDDEGRIQFYGHKLDAQEIENLGDEVPLQKISCALKKTGPIRASTHNRNDEHIDLPSSTLMLITWIIDDLNEFKKTLILGPGPYARRFDGSHPFQLRRSAFFLLKQIFSSAMLLMRTAPAPSRFRPPPDPPPCGHFHGSLQLQPSSSVSNPIKQLSSPMAPVVTVSPPSPFHLPPPPLRLRLPPDPLPPWSSATVLFESLSQPEPPDTPDASLSLVIHRLFDTPFTLSQASFNIPNLASDGVVSLVFVDGTIFGSKCLYPAVCSVIFSRLVVWRRHCSSLTCVGSLTPPFILVCLLSSISVCSLVEWSERFVVYVAPNLSVMDLDYNVPMNFVSFGSTSMHVDGSQVTLV